MSTIFKEIIQCDSEWRLASEGNGEILVGFVFPTSSLSLKFNSVRVLKRRGCKGRDIRFNIIYEV